MNELKLLEAINLIDDELINEADRPYTPRPAVNKGRIAMGAAAAIAIAIGGGVFFSAKPPANEITDSIAEVPESSAAPTVSEKSSAASKANSPADSIAVLSSQNDTENISAEDSASAEVRQDISSAEGAEGFQPFESEAEISAAESLTVDSSSQNEKPTVQKGGATADDLYYKPFTATVDPDTDSYGEEELQHIDVRTAEGFYRQLNADEYAKNGLPTEVSDADFGGYIGRLTEVDSYAQPISGTETQEPKLAGAEVYYYAPTGKNKAFIIVKAGAQCSIFMADEVDTSKGFKNGLEFFDVQSAEDIAAVAFTVDMPSEDGRMYAARQGEITDRESIEELYTLLCSLQPEDYSALPEHIGTPRWLTDAWAAYKADPEPSPRDDFSITITLKDGTVLQEIRYQPFLGNGYVFGMCELTPEQNAELKALLS